MMYKFKEMSSGSVKIKKEVISSDLLDVEKTLVEKRIDGAERIRVPRWMSKNIAEFDLANGYWTLSEAKIDHQFYPFSKTVYLPDGSFLVLGGLND